LNSAAPGTLALVPLDGVIKIKVIAKTSAKGIG